MAKYDVFKLPGENGYLLDVQADLLGALNTRVVVPLVELDRVPKLAKRLNPVFDIEGIAVTMVPHLIATVPKAKLNSPVANLKDEFDKITRALDMLFQGF